eukprot:192843-Prymnesium_polylepis.1
MAMSREVGWSKTSVLGSRTPPSAACSWLRRSTACSESTPASISGSSASIASPSTPSTIRSTVCSFNAPIGAAGA